MHPITLNPNEIKIYKEQRKNEEKRKVIQDVMTELGKRTGLDKTETSWDNNLPQPSSGMDSLNSSSNFLSRRTKSIDLNPPSLGGSREKMWAEDMAGTESTERRMLSAFSVDSGFHSSFGSLHSL
ncbi:hypothetical protein GJAV_G00085570 [Gymnothorax javanicus]|nr:hypothetical protein GJAV_G00085570 [Gymnothorax javanicus]